MRTNDLTKVSFSILTSLALLLSCSIPNNSSNKLNKSTSANIRNHIITGKVEFPKTNKLNDNNLNYKVQATLSQIGDRATISLIYPPDDETNPNVTIATGLSDSNGAFSISTPNFEPITSKVYILEAIKRIGASGNDLISVRTYLRHNGTNWESITSPSISINKETTAITIIDKNDNSITSSDTIGKIINGNINNIGNVSISTINNVSNMVNSLLIDNLDPTRFIDYKNGKYFILKEIPANKNYLISNKICQSCDLADEDLSNLDLSSSDLSNADLKNVDLTNTNLSNADLSNVNLTNAKLNNTNFSGSKWINGTTICQNNSIDLCMFPDFLVNTYTTYNQNNPAIIMDNSGNYFVTWQSENQDGSGFGVYSKRFNSLGESISSEFRINEYITNNQGKPSIALNNNTGNIVVSWESFNQSGAGSQTDPSGNGIFREIFNNSGNSQNFELRVNSYTTNNQSNPSIVMDNIGNYLITWQSENQDGSGYGVYSQRFYSFDFPRRSEFRVNTYTTNNQINPSVAMNKTLGDFIITWQSENQDGSGYGIYAQRAMSDGFFLEPEFKINTYTTNNQTNPSVSINNSNGDFIITWQSENQDGSGFGIYAQRYNSLGNKNGNEFRVNTYTTNNQTNPSVLINSSNGDFVITWQSENQDGSYSGIFAKRYNSLGQLQGSEFRVNSYITYNQTNPSVSINSSNGDFIITWQSENQDGSNSGVYLKRYDSNGNQK
ncbi:MAG: pentapeptide repeat-containing protein [Candidatus Sericytochromatia bacterium]